MDDQQPGVVVIVAITDFEGNSENQRSRQFFCRLECLGSRLECFGILLIEKVSAEE